MRIMLGMYAGCVVERKDYEAAKLRYEESGVKRRPPVPWSLKRKYCYQRVG